MHTLSCSNASNREVTASSRLITDSICSKLSHKSRDPHMNFIYNIQYIMYLSITSTIDNPRVTEFQFFKYLFFNKFQKFEILLGWLQYQEVRFLIVHETQRCSTVTLFYKILNERSLREQYNYREGKHIDVSVSNDVRVTIAPLIGLSRSEHTQTQTKNNTNKLKYHSLISRNSVFHHDTIQMGNIIENILKNGDIG